MMREMEKVFENLKEEFNRKISSDSFISYFVNHSDVSGGGSSSESFEDISMDACMHPTGSLEKHFYKDQSALVESSEPSIITDTSNEECIFVTDDNKMMVRTEEVILEDVSVWDNNVEQHYASSIIVCTEGEEVEEVVDDVGKDVVSESSIEHMEHLHYQVIEIVRSNSADKPLNVIDEEETVEKIAEEVDDVICVQVTNTADQIVDAIIDESICSPDKEFVDEEGDHKDTLELEIRRDEAELEGSKEINVPTITSDDLIITDEQLSRTVERKESVSNGETTRARTHQDGSPMQRVVKKQSLHRMLWSEMPEVIESGILKSLPKKQIQLQEAMFEIITSEASYYRSLMILTSHFFDSDLFKIHDNKESLASPIDKHHIFSNVILIMSTSQKFLNDLDQRWLDQKPILTQICDIILKHARGDDFQHYVTYLRNQDYQSKALKRLTENEVFRQHLNKLEMSLICGKLSMDSYLMLPMQRLTRLKLLVDTLLKIMYCEELRDFMKEEHINTAEMTLDTLKMLLDTSDSEKGYMDQKSTLMLLMNKMDFPPNFKRITISDKMFIKEGEVRVHQQNPMKYVKKFSKKRQPIISMILFNDLLILAKKKGLRLFVIDYCDRTNIEVTETKYKSIASSADVSNSACSVDFDDRTDDGRKMSINSLVRSKSSLPPDELKRFSTSLTNSFRSLPLTNRNDEQEIINNSLSLKFVKSQTDIFSVPIVLLAKNRTERDEWMTILSNNSSTDGRLHKTTSLRHTAIRKEEFGINKNQSLYLKRKDD